MADSSGSHSISADARRQIVAQARQFLVQGNHSQVAKTLHPLVNSEKPDAEALYILALISQRENRIEDALRIADVSFGIQNHPETLMLIAACQRESGDLAGAVKNCDTLLKHNPRNIQVLCLKADALQEAGDLDEADEILTQLMRSFKSQGKPVPPGILSIRAKLLMQQKENDEAIKVADVILGRPELPPPVRKSALFTKTKACDRVGQYEAAFASATEAHTINSPPFDAAAHEASISKVIEIWSKEKMADFPVSSCDSQIPVFIAGMPRSGTSLLDQIIDAHPKAAGVGELGTVLRFAAEVGANYDPAKPAAERFGSCDSARWTEAAWEYVNQITSKAPPEATRIVNKAIGNDTITGLIARMFPAARIIHITRDPRDVATSCFLGAFNSRMYPWTGRLDWVAKAWEQSERLMNHWKSTLDYPILDVRYEDLATDPGAQIPRVLEFVGLEPDDRCFEFYKSKRRVRTLSHDQVSRPMYTSSIGRYRNYAEHIEKVSFQEYH